jgi:hypothetical protein
MDNKAIIKSNLIQPEPIEEVGISPFKIVLIYAKTGQQINLCGEPVIDNETGCIVGYTSSYMIPFRLDSDATQ